MNRFFSGVTHVLPRPKLIALTLLSFVVLVSGCGKQRVTPGDSTPAVQARKPTPELARSLLNSGDQVQAAHVYAQLSSIETDPLQQQQYQLLAAELYFDNELYNDGARIFAALPATMGSEPLQQRRDIAAGYFLIAQRNPQQAIDGLADPRALTDPVLKTRILEIQARALQQLNNPAQALKARIQLEAGLADPLALQTNQIRIWDMLRTLDNNSLRAIASTPAGPIYRGWIEYAMLARAEGSMDANSFARRQALWRNRYGDHPAMAIAQNGPVDANTTLPEPTSISSGQIALLLPLTGQFSELGAAIKTGFTAAHYADAGIASVKVYDTQSDTAKAIEQYQLAAAEGASLIIGPLSKSAVVNLAATIQISVPTLSLNYIGEDIPGHSNLYQFGLLPEDEARDAANFATSANYNKALVLHSDSALAQRLANAFDLRFTESGGRVLGAELIEQDTYDYSQQLRKLLALNSSNARKRRLEELLDTKIEFEPAIRDDIDVIFMVVDPEQARLLRPQLKFHRAGEIPLLSTAMVFTGEVDAKADSDLTGVRYNEIPWLLTDATQNQSLFQSIAQYQPDDSPGFSRLTALGMDAYMLHKELEQMRLDRLYSVNGKTGALTLTEGNRIQRRLQWAEFQEGAPTKISNAISVEAALPPMLESDI
jgi:outer membrane PBP1 activator LpoA protein